MDEDQQPHHDPVPYSTPTCLQLGIPIASEPGLPGGYPDPRLPPDDVPGIPPMLESYLDPVYHDSYLSGRLPYLPFPSPYGLYDYGFEPAFIRKRNERERQRVKCVNEGYARLREHLPSDISDKRLSKVETLRAAIKYIKKLQKVLHEEEGEIIGRGSEASTTRTRRLRKLTTWTREVPSKIPTTPRTAKNQDEKEP
ncbi:helix loop helix domain [Branchiostoma belcheri]|nr:helix loop helix domain [Branchiostoma belcheri]